MKRAIFTAAMAAFFMSCSDSRSGQLQPKPKEVTAAKGTTKDAIACFHR